MSGGGPPIGLYECNSCGSIDIGREAASCCGQPMLPVGERAGVREPKLETLLSVVFGMSPTELDVCIWVMKEGEATAGALAEDLGIDRSVASRHLNHLADLGAVEKHRLLRKEGGHVYVYVPTPLEEIQRSFKLGLYYWMVGAVELIEALNRKKVEAIAEKQTDGDEWRIFTEG